MDQPEDRMTVDELVSSLRADVDDAVTFIETDIAPYRALGTNFYLGRPFGDEEDGRSQVVMPVVRDTVRSMMPSLMKIFFGGQRVVEFVGTSASGAETAREMQDAVEYTFLRKNPGFRILWDAFKDALTRKVGFVKWWWDDSVKVRARVFDNVTSEQLDAAQMTLKQDEELEVVEATLVQEETVDQMGAPVPAQYLYKIRITSREKDKCVRVMTMPPEEFIIDRWARGIDDARLVGHRTHKTRGELVAMGISPDLLDDVGTDQGGTFSLETNQELLARQPSGILRGMVNATPDQEKVLFCDLWYRIDFDGDGISELRRIVTVGSGFTVISNEYADEVCIADLCPDPEPHVLFGLSVYDNLADMQLIESHVTRDVLDSLKSSIFPRTAYVEGQVNVDDVLNTEIGAAIRMRQPGMVQTLEVPFVGSQALPVLEWLDAIKERRTGVRGSSPMIDAKALQSTNQVAVNAAVTGSQAQVELIARIFAETGVKRLFRGIAKMLMENQQGPMTVVVDGQQRQIDPRTWSIDVELEVNAGLGTGQNEDKKAALANVAQVQALVMQQLGPENPLVSFSHVYNTQKQMLELSGMRDIHNHLRDPVTYQPPPQEPPEPTPEEILAEAQMAIEAGKLDLEQLKTVLEDDFKRDQLDAEIALKAAEINARYKGQVDIASIRAIMDRKRLAQEARQHEDKLVTDVKMQEVKVASKSDKQKKPKKVIKRAIRDEQGRIVAVEETTGT